MDNQIIIDHWIVAQTG